MEVFGETDVGRVRQDNQDYIYFSGEPVGNLPNLFVVADGMGGHNAGEFASWFTVETLVKLVGDSPCTSPCHIIGESIQEVNRRLISKSYEDEHMQGMGTTLTLATVVQSILYVANIGDSRTYLINDRIHQISQDHSYVEELVREGVMERGSKEYQLQKNIITRAMGICDFVKPDFFEITLEGRGHLLLCSDGLTNMVEDEKIREIVTQASFIEKRVHHLIDTANTNGGRDNISVILVDLD